VRLVDRPQATRIRLKQTLGVLPFITLKPALDLSMDPTWLTPARARLDIKAFGCLKWRLRADGAPLLQLRARAPLEDPRFMLDILYERNLADHTDAVRVSFRGFNWAFLKAPHLGAGVKVPVSFASGVKSTIRIKQFLVDDTEAAGDPGNRSKPVPAVGGRSYERISDEKPRSAGLFGGNPGTHARHSQAVRNRNASPHSNSMTTQDDGIPSQGRYPGWRLKGPIGMDIKLRLIQFGGLVESPIKAHS
jgi:hypothetical protein